MKPARSVVVIHPEIAAAALQAKEADLYVCWLLLRALDNQRGNSGKVSVPEMLAVFAQCLGIGEKHAYTKIQRGVGKWWSRPGGKKGQRITALIGTQRVVGRLVPKMPRTEPFVLPIHHFLPEERYWRWPELKSLLISTIAARHVDHRPMSVASVIEHTGLGEATVRRHLRSCPHLKRMCNYEVVFTSRSYVEANTVLAAMLKLRGGYRLDHVGSRYLVVGQLPNTYVLPEIERLPLRTRPRALKNRDVEAAAGANSARYYTPEMLKKQPSLPKSGVKPVGETRMYQRGRPRYTRLWQVVMPDPEQAIGTMEPLQSLRARSFVNLRAYCARMAQDAR